MPLFQQSVVKKYLNDLDKDAMQQRWAAFTVHFHNAAIQQNILNNKEEEYQEGFVRDLFVTVLGYTLNPQPDYNFVLEKKTEADSTKSDGAILHSGKVVGVIELKDTTTTDLNKVEKQAFGYKHRHRDCTYVITANFQKLRFYINDAIEYEEFDLFTLTKERFDLLYLCLGEQNIFKNIPLLIKQASLTQEEAVTKKLYADYSGFRKKLFYNITELNPQYPKIELFKKTQKLLDRFLFILFAEDRMLVPANSVRKILQQWQQLKEMDAAQPLYQRFKLYFGYLNTGRPDKEEIFAYNGGLFAADEILDTIKIDDTILYDSCFALSNYDFQTEIDVNILGHIFEHSLSEIEELERSLASPTGGGREGAAKTKRKKDGVFYTPRYITKYIVANTVGTLCEQKKNELSISEEVFAYRKQKDKKRERLVKLLDDYRNWLLQITICDPACGSGAFLNQALEYLIAEHRHIDELKANLFGDAFVLTDLDNEILEHNLFGVDINEEAVDIARLSLWLRTAKKDRKLSSLTSHIQCGNSLIDDPAVAGDKAFNWQKAFPKIFEKGGFDVVIGNPPYVRQELIKQYSTFLEHRYKSFSGKADLYVYFFEKSLEILKENGFLSFICSGKFFEANYGKPLVDHIVKNSTILEVIDFGDFEVFEGISAYPAIISLKKQVTSNDYNFYYLAISNLSFENIQDVLQHPPFSIIDKRIFEDNGYKFISSKFDVLFKKLNKDASSLSNLNLLPLVGIKTGFNDGFISSKEISNFIKPYAFGRDIKKYEFVTPSFNIIFPYQTFNNEYTLTNLDQLGEIRNELENHKSKLTDRAIIKEGVEKGIKKWYEYQQIKRNLIFDNEYIVYPNVSLGNNFTLSKGIIIDMTGFIIPSNSKSLLAILNSSVTKFLMNQTAISRRGGYLEYKVQYLEKIPIKQFSNEDEIKIVSLVDIMFQKNNELDSINKNFTALLSAQFHTVSLTKKLEQWPSLSFAELLKELGKQKIKPTLPQQSEWMNYFEEQKTKAVALQTVIDTTDKEIDAMVYALYGLSAEEIKIVEGNG